MNKTSGLAFAQTLITLRKTANLTQAELATKLDISTGYVSSVENGTECPSLNFVIEVALQLNLELSELMRMVEENMK